MLEKGILYIYNNISEMSAIFYDSTHY